MRQRGARLGNLCDGVHEPAGARPVGASSQRSSAVGAALLAVEFRHGRKQQQQPHSSNSGCFDELFMHCFF